MGTKGRLTLTQIIGISFSLISITALIINLVFGIAHGLTMFQWAVSKANLSMLIVLPIFILASLIPSNKIVTICLIAAILLLSFIAIYLGPREFDGWMLLFIAVLLAKEEKLISSRLVYPVLAVAVLLLIIISSLGRKSIYSLAGIIISGTVYTFLLVLIFRRTHSTSEHELADKEMEIARLRAELHRISAADSISFDEMLRNFILEYKLTEREAQLLLMLAEYDFEIKNSALAVEMRLSLSTVKNTVNSLFKKTGTHSRMSLASKVRDYIRGKDNG